MIDLKWGGAENVGIMANGGGKVVMFSPKLSGSGSAVKPGGKEGVAGPCCDGVLG